MSNICGAFPDKEVVLDFIDKNNIEVFDHIPDSEKAIQVGLEPADPILENPLTDAAENLVGAITGEDAEVNLTASFKVGRKIILPDSTPTGWPPYAGARNGHAWHDRTRRTVGLIRRKAQSKSGRPIVCATYIGHGTTGIKFGIDAMVSKFGQKANNAEENAGDRLVNWALRNWGKLNLNYIIWWNWMNHGQGWFDYEPIRRQWSGGSQALVPSRHLDHGHFQVDSPFIAGNN